MKYISLFETFEGDEFQNKDKYELLDIFWMHPNEVQALFFNELHKQIPNMDNIRVFLESGLVDVNVKDKLGYAGLHWAVALNNIELTKKLIDLGADVDLKDYYDNTPLHVAVGVCDNIILAELLIDSGADVNAKGSGGETPLNSAYSKEMRNLLTEHGGTL